MGGVTRLSAPADRDARVPVWHHGWSGNVGWGSGMAVRRRAGGIAVAATGVLLLAGCGGDDKKAGPDPKSQGTAASAPAGVSGSPGGAGSPTGGGTAGTPSVSASTSASTAPATGPKPTPFRGTARIGEPLQMTDGGNQPFEVTLLRVVDPALPQSESTAAEPTGRLVAVEWRITNVGIAVLDASPAADVKLIDAQGKAYDFSIGGQARGEVFPAVAQIPPGQTRTGFVTYELPLGAKLAKVEHIGGFDQPPVQWQLP